MNKLSTKIKDTSPALAGVSIIAGFIADVLQPIAPFSGYIFFTAAVASIALSIAYFIKKALHDKLKVALTFSIMISMVTGAMYTFQDENSHSGLLADNFKLVASIQSSLGMVQEDVKVIKETTRQTLDSVKRTESMVATSVKTTQEVKVSVDNLATGIRNLAKVGGLISDPHTSSELYHNARIFAQRGESDLAIDSYKKLFNNKVKYADPVMDFSELLIENYGLNTAKEVINDTLGGENNQLRLFALQNLEDTPNEEIMHLIADGKAAYPPMVLAWASKQMMTLYDQSEFSRCIYVMASEFVKESVNTGKLYKYYIDKLRVRSEADIQRRMWEDTRSDEYSAGWIETCYSQYITKKS